MRDGSRYADGDANAGAGSVVVGAAEAEAEAEAVVVGSNDVRSCPATGSDMCMFCRNYSTSKHEYSSQKCNYNAIAVEFVKEAICVVGWEIENDGFSGGIQLLSCGGLREAWQARKFDTSSLAASIAASSQLLSLSQH